MTRSLWRVLVDGQVALARGSVEAGPQELLRGELHELLSRTGGFLSAFEAPAMGPVPSDAGVLVPLDRQELWAAGVTFVRSREARREESATPDHYDQIYDAERPELFMKAAPGRAQGPGAPVAIRADSEWNVPEPELAVLADAGGQAVAYSVGNDVSSRSIEGANPLYLPQAKIYRHSGAVGPCWVPIDDVAPLEQLVVRCVLWRDGRPIFEDSASLGAMRRRPGELLDWLYRAQDFPSGVALLTGTSIVPPPAFSLRCSDVVRIGISGVGTLENPVEVVGARLAEWAPPGWAGGPA